MDRDVRSAASAPVFGVLRRYAETALMVAASTAAGMLAAPRWGAGPVDLLFLPPVLAAASLWGLRSGLFAAIASALCYNFFFTRPFHSLRIDRPSDVVTVAILFLVAVVTSQLAARMRRAARLAAANATRNATIAGFARALLPCRTEAEVAQSACAQIAEIFACNAVLIAAGEGAALARVPPSAPLTPSDFAAAQWALDSGRAAGRGSVRGDPADWLFTPVSTDKGVIAALGLARDDGLPPVPADRSELLHNLLDQMALALARVRLERDMQGMAELQERDRLRAALLSSVSHDLRTPLTAISAAASELREQMDGESTLPATIGEEAAKLERYVSNLLDMARIEAGAVRLRDEPLDLVDAVASALHDLRTRLHGREVTVRLNGDLPLVRADPQLLHHCLINLLDNAVRHAPQGTRIAIEGRMERGGTALAVEDEGPGLGGAGLRLFDTFARIDGSDRSGGAGLGLAIVKGFAEAMGLEVFASDRDGAGATVGLFFPHETLIASVNVDEQGA